MMQHQMERSSLQALEAFIMYTVTKISMVMSIFLSLLPASLAEAASQSSPLDSDTVWIEVSGQIPGFTHAKLTSYLARKMQDDTGAPWHFAVLEPGAEHAPNRVAWSFTTLRKVWEGGVHNGFPTPTNSVTYISAEVKLYLNDSYQMTFNTHPSVGSGSDDKVLSEMVHNVSHALFVANKPGGMP